MKQLFKTLTALTLSFMLVFTSLAAPLMAGTVESASEETDAVAAEEAAADLAADVVITGKEEKVLKEYSFDTDAEGWKFISETWTHDGGTEGGQSYEGGLDGDGAYYIESVIEYKTDTITKADGSTSKKNYGTDLRVENTNLKGLNLNTENITKIEVRVKNTTGKSQSLKMYWYTTNYGISEARTLSQNYDGSDWTVVTFDMTGLTADNGWVDTLTGIRFKVGTTAANTYSIDYIKIYGYETEVHEWLPGYNLLTGTKEAVTFDEAPFTGTNISGNNFIDDNGNKLDITLGYATEMSVEAPATDSTNKALRITNLTGSTSYPHLVFKDLEVPNDGRPIFTSAKAMVTDIDQCSQNANDHLLRINPNGSSSGSGAILKASAVKSYNSTATTGRTFTQKWVKDETSTRTKVGVFMFTVSKGTTDIGSLTGVKPSVWLDDIMYVPYYKVTYMNGDQQIGEPVWVLDDGNGNILESFNPDDYFTGEYPEGTNAWSLTKGGKATHEIALNNEDIVVYAVYERDFIPGINILTGTETPLNFDDGTYSVKDLTVLDETKNVVMTAKDVASISVVPSPVSAQDGYVVKYDITDLPKDTSKYPKVYFNQKDSSGNYVNKMPTDGRPIYVGYNVLVHNADNLSKTATRYNWIMSTGSVHTGHTYNIPQWYLSTQTPVWYETKGVNIPIVNGEIPYIQTSYISAVDFTDEMVKPNFYFDNFMYVPYYKVTYMNGTTELGSAYVLDDGKGNLLTSFNPADYDDKIVFPVGVNAWSLTQGGKVVTDIPLENEDIVVYGTFEAKNTDKTVYAIEYDDNFDTSNTNNTYSRISHHSVADGVLTVNANIPASVTADDATYTWDAILGYNNISLTGANIDRIVIRAKFAESEMAKEATYLKDEDGNVVYNEKGIPQIDENISWVWRKDTVKSAGVYNTNHPDNPVKEYTFGETKLNTGSVECHFQVKGSSTYYNISSLSLSGLEYDDEGYALITFNVSAFAEESKTAWNNNEISYFRIDLPSVCCAAQFDYVRFYGPEGDDFVPTASAPQKREGNSIKFDEELNKTGIRYRAAMKNDVKANTNLTQYGWIVALAEKLGGNELTHQFKLADGKTAYVEGIAYGTLSDGTKIDRVFQTEEDHTIFTAVVVGIPADKADMELVVRPYSIINGAYAYGNSVITSPAEVAEKLYQKWLTESGDETNTSYDYVNHKEFIDTLRGANA